MIERERWIIVAGDFYGMSRYDEPTVGKYLVSDWSNLKAVPDTLSQGMVKYVMYCSRVTI